MNIIKPYQYLFYRTHELLIKIYRKRYTPENSAYTLTGLLLFVNFLSLLTFVGILVDINTIKFMVANKFFMAIGSLIINEVLSYFLFIKNDRWVEIIKKFQKESEERRKRNTILVIAYIFITFLVFTISLISQSPSKF